MAITVPQPTWNISAVDFGQPVANQLNALAPTAWTNLTLQNSWTALTACQYRKVNDIVYVRGSMQNGTPAAGTVLATLPSGFRPTATFYVTQPYYFGGWKHGVLQLEPTGDVKIGADALAGSAQPLSLDRIYFSIV